MARQLLLFQLTDQGRKQVVSAGDSFGKELLPSYHKLLASPAPRTMETAALFVQAACSSGHGRHDVMANSEVEIQPIQGLYDGTMQPEGSRLFQKIV